MPNLSGGLTKLQTATRFSVLSSLPITRPKVYTLHWRHMSVMGAFWQFVKQLVQDNNKDNKEHMYAQHY